MYRIALALILMSGVVQARDRGGDFAACRHGQDDIAHRIHDFHGEEHFRQIIEADLQRAHREENEGDADECLEAVAHADKLLRGQY